MADMNALYDLLESSTLYSAQNKLFSYAKSNPGEAAAVEAYWRNGGTRPAAATKFGSFLLDVVDELRGVQPPPPAGNKLTWAPAPGTYQDLVIPPTGGQINLQAGVNYNLIQTQKRTQPLILIGGHHIKWIGGEVDISNNTSGVPVERRFLHLQGQTGVVHLEGLWAHGNSLAYGITWDLRNCQGGVQIQNCRITDVNLVNPNSGDLHGDVIQSWYGPPGGVRIDRLTTSTDYRHFLWMAADSATFPDYIHARKVNGFISRQLPGYSHKQKVELSVQAVADIEIRYEDVWFEVGWHQDSHRVGLKDVCGSRNPNIQAVIWDWTEHYADGRVATGPHIDEIATQSAGVVHNQGDYIEFINPEKPKNNLWNWGKTGPGRIYAADTKPPGGDFVLASLVGLGYLSPGYE